MRHLGTIHCKMQHLGWYTVTCDMMVHCNMQHPGTIHCNMRHLGTIHCNMRHLGTIHCNPVLERSKSTFYLQSMIIKSQNFFLKINLQQATIHAFYMYKTVENSCSVEWAFLYLFTYVIEKALSLFEIRLLWSEELQSLDAGIPPIKSREYYFRFRSLIHFFIYIIVHKVREGSLLVLYI